MYVCGMYLMSPVREDLRYNASQKETPADRIALECIMIVYANRDGDTFFGMSLDVVGARWRVDA